MASTTPPGSPPPSKTFQQRTPKSGTTEDIESLSLRYPDLKSATSYHTLTNKHLDIFREKSDKLAQAEKYFRAEKWHLCKSQCNEITGVEGSAAIEARAFTLLAERKVTLVAHDRSFYAEAAVDCWQKVIDRKGISRFPRDEARKLQLEAGRMVEEAESAMDIDITESSEGLVGGSEALKYPVLF